MTIGARKAKVMPNSFYDIKRELIVIEQMLGTVTNFQNLKPVSSDYGSKPEVF